MPRSLFYEVAGLQRATLLKNNFVKFLRTPFYIEHIWWLLLCLLFMDHVRDVRHVLPRFQIENNLRH